MSRRTLALLAGWLLLAALVAVAAGRVFPLI